MRKVKVMTEKLMSWEAVIWNASDGRGYNRKVGAYQIDKPLQHGGGVVVEL